jgi:peptidoglycan hydrolase-like protein with peptidoglycan-binding domain
VDGVFGSRTDAAVRAFQRAHGLVVDGIVGQRTWSSVILTVQRGNVGPAVRAVQDQANFRNLRGEGPPALQIDGVFGADTGTWVRGYQSAFADDAGFPVDGIVGALTWQALVTETLSGWAPQSPTQGARHPP